MCFHKTVSQVKGLTSQWHDANLNLWLWRRRGAVIVIILLYKALIKLPLILSPAARQRILLATLGISFTKKFSGLNWIWPSFSCQKFMGGGGVISLKVRRKVNIIDFDKKNEMVLSFHYIHHCLTNNCPRALSFRENTPELGKKMS